MKRITPPFETGQTVTTDFYEREKHLPRTVIRCYPSKGCQSGWLVDTAIGKKVLKELDSDWFRLRKEAE